MLYVINKLHGIDKLEIYLLRARPESTVLFIEDAVCAVKTGSKTAEIIGKYLSHLTVCAVAPDLVTRGLTENQVLAEIILVDYDEFVELTVSNRIIQFWF